MKIDTVKHKVEQSGVQNHNEFSIRSSSKAFELLIAGLYSSPIKAFIRELSTNAHEAHQMIGLPDKPFDVSLPTSQDCSFIIRDYGPGLSPEEIRTVYTSIFNSTKDKQNDVGGCFGLGSKSPFAYVGNAPFSVTSINGGKKWYYTCYRNDDGVPCMDLLHSIECNEDTGLEITVPCKRFDISSIYTACQEIYSWFDVKPNIIRSDRAIILSDYKLGYGSPALIGPDFAIYQENKCIIKMGDIAYPIDFNEIKINKIFNGITIYAPIGSVIPDPSRERLTYNPHTRTFLKTKFDEILEFISDNLSKQLDECECYFDAVVKASKIVQSFNNIHLSNLKYRGVSLRSHYFTLQYGKVHSTYNGKVKYSQEKDFHYTMNNTAFICIDTKTYKPRVTTLVNTSLRSASNLVMCEANNLKLCADEIGIPESRFILTSSVPYTPVRSGVPRVGTGKGHKTKVLKWINGSYGIVNAWEDSEIDLFGTTGYYVEYYANKLLFTNKLGKTIHASPEDLYVILECLGLPRDTIVYGIKSELLKKVKNKLQTLENLLTKFENFIYNNDAEFKKNQEYRASLENIEYEPILRLKSIITKYGLKSPKNLDDIVDKIQKGVKYDNLISYSNNHVINNIIGINLRDKYKGGPDKQMVLESEDLISNFKLLSDISIKTDKDNVELFYYLKGKGL